jgi:hypothetical protein
MKVIRLILISYLIAGLFLGLFGVIMLRGPQAIAALKEPQWALLIAFIMIAPLLVPFFLAHLLPRLDSIKAGFVELSFKSVEVATQSLLVLSEQLKTIPEQTHASEFASMMTSYSSVIVDSIKKVQATQDEILVVDLRDGRAWIPPNLYFLALLVTTRTSVRQLVFVESRHVDEVFVGMCTPGALLPMLGEKLPLLRNAATDSNTQERSLAEAGHAFFGALAKLYQNAGDGAQVKDWWLTSSTLFALVGNCLHREQIEWKDSASEEIIGESYAAKVLTSQL